MSDPNYYEITSLPGVRFVIKDDYDALKKRVEELEGWLQREEKIGNDYEKKVLRLEADKRELLDYVRTWANASDGEPLAKELIKKHTQTKETKG